MEFTTSKETLTLYKLIVLFMLSRVDFPLTQTQINDFIIDKEYMNYLTLQQILAELTESNLISSHTYLRRTQFVITEEGRDTLRFFEARIGEGAKRDIIQYFKEHSLDLRNEVSVASHYYKTIQGEYETFLSAKDKDTTLIEIKLSVPTSQMADAVCSHWKEKNQEIYEMLTKELF